MNIKTIIFDLGGVIIDLDEFATIKAFADLGNISIEQVQYNAKNNPDLLAYEKGLISDTDFRNGCRNDYGQGLTNAQIDDAWNAMLGDIPIERLELLAKLRKHYKVAILSNTNHIHELAFNKILERSSGQKSLHAFADEVYFSHEMHMRKPDLEIYEKVLALSATKPNDALFLDDKLENLQGAQEASIQTMHISSPDEIFKLNMYVE